MIKLITFIMVGKEILKNYVILVNNNSKKTHLDSNFYQKRIDPLGKSFLLNVKTFIPEGTYSALFKVMCVVV